MPRKPDVALEGRIVDAAYRIWSQQGEGSVTMRAVARAARPRDRERGERARRGTTCLPRPAGRVARGAEEADANQPLQPAPHLARPRTPGA